MQVKRYNISKATKKYMDRNGQEKTQWDNVGTMTEFTKDDGRISRIIEIPAIGLDANVFPIEPKENYQNNQQQYQKPQHSEAEMQGMASAVGGEVVNETEIKPEDIPF